MNNTHPFLAKSLQGGKIFSDLFSVTWIMALQMRIILRKRSMEEIRLSAIFMGSDTGDSVKTAVPHIFFLESELCL